VTADERRDAVLCAIGAELDLIMTAQALRQADIHLRTGLSKNTLHRVLSAYDCRVSTLVDIGEAIGHPLLVTFCSSLARR
jgi:hypothetical protein